MIEAAWLKDGEAGATEVWGKCGNCHTPRMIATNAPDPPEGQPFCSCSRCGQLLYAYDAREQLVATVVKHGWNRAIVWLMAHGIGDDDGSG